MTDFARLAEDVRRTFLERYATEHERALLEAASDPGTIVVRMAYGEDLIVRPPGAKPIDASELPPATDEQSQRSSVASSFAPSFASQRASATRVDLARGAIAFERALDLFAERDSTRGEVILAAQRLHREFVAEQRSQRRQLKHRLAESRAQNARQAFEDEQSLKRDPLTRTLLNA